MTRTAARFTIGIVAALVATSWVAAAEHALTVVEDTWIHGTGSTSPAGGTDTRLGICPVVDYWIYLKFDLSAQPATTCTIVGTELRMVRTGGTNPTEIALYPITQDDWSELTLTGVNRPEPVSPPSGTGIATGEALVAEGYDRWTSSALDGFVSGEAAGDGIATLMLREDHGEMFDVRFYNSKDAVVSDGDKPTLVLDTIADEATGLVLDANGVVTLSWESTPRVAAYDVVGGDLESLRADQSVGAANCLAEDLAEPTYDLPGGDPAPGEGSYFLVRVVDVCGVGGYGADSAGQERQPLSDCLP